jgi:uncharacterized protein
MTATKLPEALLLLPNRCAVYLQGLAMKIAIGIAVGFVVAILLIRTLENRLIYFPPRYPTGFVPPEHYGLQVEEVWMTTEDGVKLNGYFLPQASSPSVLLWFHGNAENIGFGLEQMKVLANLCINILEVDYRGYGKSEGSPDEPAIYRDADAAYDYLVKTRHFQPRNIIIYGHSLGGAAAVDLASRRECGGLVVQSSFTSAREMARRMFAIPLLEYFLKSSFDSLKKIQNVRVPVLIAHGTRDETIPFFMGQRLYRAAPEPKLFIPVEGAGHNDILAVAGELYLRRLREFIRSGSGQTKPRAKA